MQAIDSEARWHPSGWSLVFIGGDTLSATAQSLAGFTTLRHRKHALTMVYRPMTTLPAMSAADDEAGVIVARLARNSSTECSRAALRGLELTCPVSSVTCASVGVVGDCVTGWSRAFAYGHPIQSSRAEPPQGRRSRATFHIDAPAR